MLVCMCMHILGHISVNECHHLFVLGLCMCMGTCQPHIFFNAHNASLRTLFPSPHFFPSFTSIFDNKRQDPSGLTALLQNTDLVGVLHMLYCILLHSTVPEPQSGSIASLQEPYSPAVVQVALQGLRYLNSFAMLDLTAFQVLSQYCSAEQCFQTFSCHASLVIMQGYTDAITIITHQIVVSR